MMELVFERRGARLAPRRTGTIVWAISVLAIACAGEPPVLGEPITVVEAGATHPTVAIDGERGTYYVAWVGVHEGQSNVWLARSTGGERFESPVRVNDIDGDAAPHEQAPAQVAVAPDGTVYIVWQNNTFVEGRRFPFSDLRFARSSDGGRTFEPAITVNDDAGTPASHTFHNLTVGRNGTVYITWIDGRASAAAERELAAQNGSDDAAAGHHHEMSDDPNVPPQEIRVAWSTDGGRSFGTSSVVASDPCPCCRTSIVVASDGALLVGWRAIFDDNIRDVVVARSADGGATFDAPVRVHEDGWQIDGCPHVGPSLAALPDSTIHVAWYTGADDAPGVQHALSRDGGRTFEKQKALLDDGWVPISRVQLAAAADGRILAAWDDARTNPARPVVAWIQDGNVAADTLTSGGTFPVVAAAGEHIAVAWLAGDSVKARTARGLAMQAHGR